MRDMAAPGDRLGPAGIAQQIGGKKRQRIGRHAKRRANLGLTRERSHRGVDVPPARDELADQEACNITAATGNQDRLRHRALHLCLAISCRSKRVARKAT